VVCWILVVNDNNNNIISGSWYLSFYYQTDLTKFVQKTFKKYLTIYKIINKLTITDKFKIIIII